mmetsp:Transcript_28605/g.82488  ORF Transcript_28605/g.82488 Transcript_28605/m.82488 type:complete len:303 (-) Transcript_28605:1433-2341(-)
MNVSIHRVVCSRGPFTMILDAPNIAYQRQNTNRGHFSYLQIEMVKEELVRRGERPLIVLPRHYYWDRVKVPNCSKGTIRTLAREVYSERTVNWDVLAPEDKELVKKWEDEGCLFVCNFKAHDDYYWILATLMEDTTLLHESVPNNMKAQFLRRLDDYRASRGEGGGAGGETAVSTIGRNHPPVYIVTNDLLRDHHLTMLEPRAFRRWRSSTLINFDFERPISHLDPQSLSRRPDFHVQWPPTFSREPQKVEGRRCWHIPVWYPDQWREAPSRSTGAKKPRQQRMLPEPERKQTGWLCLCLDL